ncbi:TetR family transcriptional regulator [Frondihabitans cladoniiphilus]|uniref:TetR family transcriptional regulator n=1 Tax=Frondihabitans cladoniiphilus TaxID=715785 RepID=UPI0031EBA137
MIERTALDLFLRNGFDATTMDDIAAACGLGRTTVFRYFRFKEAILWYGFDVHIDDLRSRLDEQPAGKALSARVRDAVLEAFSRSQDDDGMWIARFRVLQASDGLNAETSHRWLLWAEAVSAYVAGQTASSGGGDVLAAAFGGAIQATYLTTLRRWVAEIPDVATRDGIMRTNVDAVARLFAPTFDA